MRVRRAEAVKRLQLLPQDQLIQTSRVDHADWNYRPVLSYIMRRRFALVCCLLAARPVNRLLELGFGSGIFMRELSHRCRELYGIDVHGAVTEVQTCLEQLGVHAVLSQQDAAHTDFPDGFFDVVVSVSALEFVEQIEGAARELSRVLASKGRLVFVMPQKSALVDFALHVATGEDANRDYGDRREHVLPALSKYFRIIRMKKFAAIYAAYQLERLE